MRLMINYNYNISDNNNFILTEKHGLKKKIKLDVGEYYKDAIWYNLDHYTQINTLRKLFQYIQYNINDHNEIILPNKIKCNVIELIDYIYISYIHTHNFLLKNGFTPLDMNSDNIFIHQLNKRSYINDKKIKNIKKNNIQI